MYLCSFVCYFQRHTGCPVLLCVCFVGIIIDFRCLVVWFFVIDLFFFFFSCYLNTLHNRIAYCIGIFGSTSKKWGGTVGRDKWKKITLGKRT